MTYQGRGGKARERERERAGGRQRGLSVKVVGWRVGVVLERRAVCAGRPQLTASIKGAAVARLAVLRHGKAFDLLVLGFDLDRLCHAVA